MSSQASMRFAAAIASHDWSAVRARMPSPARAHVLGTLPVLAHLGLLNVERWIMNPLRRVRKHPFPPHITIAHGTCQQAGKHEKHSQGTVQQCIGPGGASTRANVPLLLLGNPGEPGELLEARLRKRLSDAVCPACVRDGFGASRVSRPRRISDDDGGGTVEFNQTG